MLSSVIDIIRRSRDYAQLPSRARKVHRRDRWSPRPRPRYRSGDHPGINWLCRAQDESQSRDQGIARHFSLIDGWGDSYPETTRYAIPIFLEAARRYHRSDLRDRARQMLEWLVSIQFEDGGFKGGTIEAESSVPLVFNTGQILLGLAAGLAEFGDQFREPTIKAADWLVRCQDRDGC